MTNYNIEKIENGVATIRYEGGSWAEILLDSAMDSADLNHMVHQYAPKTGVAPTFATAGYSSTSANKVISDSDSRPAYVIARTAEYGSLDEQIEYITENGLDAWQTRVAKIKTDNPKPE